MKALITGFELDAACPYNSSFEVMRRLNKRVGALEIVTDALRCDYRDPVGVIRALAEKHHPDVFLCMGQALRREVISLEKVAINYQNDEREPAAGGGDYYGFVPRHRPVVEGAPDVYMTNLPVDAMLARLREREFPCEISLTAGAVGCNNAMYSLLHFIHTEAPHMLGGFIHVPANHEHPRRMKKSYSIDYIAEGIEVALSAIEA